MKNASVASRRIVIGGASLIAATGLFGVVFGYLAVAFDYPDVLDRPADQVLPALLALGSTGRLVWWVYGAIPLLLIPVSRGIDAAVGSRSPQLGRAARWLGGISALSMMLGLLRWPTLQWSLAQAWVAAPPLARDMLSDRFDTANLVLGNVIGEFLGELCLNGFFLVASLALAPVPKRRPWLLVVGMAATGLGWVAMFRNVTPMVAGVAALNNTVLPLWMLTLGVVMIRSAERVNASRQMSIGGDAPRAESD